MSYSYYIDDNPIAKHHVDEGQQHFALDFYLRFHVYHAEWRCYYHDLDHGCGCVVAGHCCGYNQRGRWSTADRIFRSQHAGPHPPDGYRSHHWFRWLPCLNLISSRLIITDVVGEEHRTKGGRP